MIRGSSLQPKLDYFFRISPQLTERLWFYLNLPMWYILIVYAVVELILIYTYQFKGIKDQWSKLYNTYFSILMNNNVTEEEL